MSDIFISYASEDKPKARQLFEAFEKLEWSVFWDRDISTGKSFHEVIDEELAQAKAVVVLWSERSVKKNWVLEEAQDGLERKILIPVFIEQVKPPRGFRLIQTASLIGWDGSINAPGFLKLVKSVAVTTALPPSVMPSGGPKETKQSYWKKRYYATWLNVLQRMVNRPALPIKKIGYGILAVLMVLMLVAGGWYFNARSADYNEGLRLYQTKQYAEAYHLFLKAADKGDVYAQYQLGAMYRDGIGVRQDYKESVKWLREAADRGYALAQRSLGARYYNGEGVDQSYQEAFNWYKKAAEQGVAEAQYTFGFMYEHSQGVKQDNDMAVKWYTKAAEQGNMDAQYKLGVMYRDGLGVKRNYDKSVDFFKDAATQGHVEAQKSLGVRYYKGEGVGKSYQEAHTWYRKAADQGDAEAQYRLGIMYEYAKGVTQNKASAISWYRKAAKQGHLLAQDNLKRLGETW